MLPAIQQSDITTMLDVVAGLKPLNTATAQGFNDREALR